jgi:RNA 2',3'-cyclic 3'-phosphodiesterase
VRRVFLAVWPPDEVLDRLAALERPQTEGLRWTRRDQWHVTLRFLGSMPDAAAVTEALRGLDLPPAHAVLGPAVDRFGRRILHVPVAGLDEVAAGVVGATTGLGRPPDDRPFSGHITLARVSDRARVDLRPLTGSAIEATWWVEGVCLVESRLSPHGARYDVLDEFAVRLPPRPGAGAGATPPGPADGSRRTS